MLWFRKKEKTVFPLLKHVYAAKEYIKERLIVPEETKPDPLPVANRKATSTQTTAASSGQQSPREPGVQYSLRTPAHPSDRRGPYMDAYEKELRQKYMQWEAQWRKYDTFSFKVLNLLKHKQIDPRTFYRQAGMDRKLFSKLKTDFCYQPRKETAIRCCLALHLSVSEAQDLLKSAGYALSDSSSFDLAVRYCLDNGVYDLAAVNMLLDALDEKILA